MLTLQAGQELDMGPILDLCGFGGTLSHHIQEDILAGPSREEPHRTSADQTSTQEDVATASCFYQH